ncbi:MAG: DMT family transporter [Lachnospiraceae bacterium]|nr:DMT family transporter [Lachnospiraceae bacterium]
MSKAKLKYITAMLIFGSVGLFVRLIPLPSAQIALFRGITGSVVMLAAMFILHEKLSWKRVRADMWVLLASGAAIGINWILLFQAYRFTSIANATICYYLAPVLVLFASPLILKEKLTWLKTFCILAAVVGIVLMTGGGSSGGDDLAGILLGLGAAVFYATVIILNKFLRHVTDYERTVIQLAFAALSLLPYVLLATPFVPLQGNGELNITGVILLLVLGVFHTGFAYYLYFSGLHSLKGQTAALLSYIDPMTAILFSTLLLSEAMGGGEILGGILILGGAMLGESRFSQKMATKEGLAEFVVDESTDVSADESALAQTNVYSNDKDC